jgi:hypothetical protein
MLEKSMAGTICDLVERIFHVEKNKIQQYLTLCPSILTHAIFLYDEEERIKGQNWLWAKMIDQCARLQWPQ